MREALADLLGVLAVLLIAAGVGVSVFEWIGWWSLTVSGAVVLVASEVSSARNKPKDET
jgi:4-hydroxybenzoate polyprenyltransferase